MLVLTRMTGESIVIGSEIRITVLGIAGKQVKIGVAAPDRVPVYRDEIYKKIKSENVRASMSLKEDLQELARIIKKSKRKDGDKKT